MSYGVTLINHAAENYAAGRAAARCGLGRSTGSLLHHAIELLLKACLFHRFTRDELKNTFGHRLRRLWNEYKSGDPQLDRFDAVIAEVDACWFLRYPDAIVDRGTVTFFLSWAERRADRMASHPAIVGTQRFEIVMHDVDLLVLTLLDHLGADPRLLRPLAPDGLDAVLYENPCSMRWMPPSWLWGDYRYD